MKKYGKLLAFAFLSFFLIATSVFARENMTIDDLGNEALKINPDTNYIYVIGKYAFTSGYTLDMKDIMLAARSIDATAEDGYTKDGNIYQKMSIQMIVPTMENFEITGWKAVDNLVSGAQLPEKFEIKYIDYQFEAEVSNATIDFTKANGEDNDYKTALKDSLKFENGNKTHSENLNYDSETGKLTGLLLRYDNMDESIFSGTDKTGYYFAFVVEVPNASDKTTIKLVGANNTKNFTYSNFDVKTGNGKTAGMVVLYAVDPKTELEDRKIQVIVDLDGETELKYGPTSYEIDYSELKLQELSKGSDFEVATETGMSETDKTTLTTTWGFDFSKNSVNKEAGKLKGELKEQTVHAGFRTDAGYYLPLKITLPEGLENYKGKVSLILNDEDNGTREVKLTDDDFTNGYIIVLFKINENENEISYKIDFDGSEGKDYLPEEVKITTEFTFKTENKITFNYFDETTGKVKTEEKIVYQNEKLDEGLAPALGTYKYHKFDYWYEEGKSADTGFDFANEVTDKNEDITLKAHWTIDSDAFLTDVINDLAEAETDYSDDFTNVFAVSKSANTVTFKVLDSAAKLSIMNTTSIPGTIAYLLQRGEVKEVILTLDGKQVKFTKDGDNNVVETIANSLDADLEARNALKESIKTGAKTLFETVLTDAGNMTLNKMATEHRNYKLTIATLDPSVKLKENASADYTFEFVTDITAVSNEDELTNALSDTGIKYIDIVSDFPITKVHEINTPGLVIKSAATGNKTLTSNSALETMFQVKTANVTIKNLKLTGKAKTAISVDNTATLTADNVDFSGIAADQTEGAAVEVKSGGTFTGTNLKYTGEKYMKPLVKALNNANVNVTVNDKTVNPTTVEEIKKYDGNKETFTESRIGDTKQTKAGYDYKHYFLNSEVANRWIKVTYIANRSITYYPLAYTIYHDKETDAEFLEEPEGVKYINSFENGSAKYELDKWNGNDKTYEKGKIPVAEIKSSEISFGAEYKATYKDHVREVTNENDLKDALKAPEVTTIVVKNEIELTDKLVIDKEGVVITGSQSGATKIVGTLKGMIEVTANKVIFDQINIVGVNNSVGTPAYVVKVTGTEFDSSQANYSIESGNFDSILYYDVANPDSALFYNTFDGKGNTSTYIKFNQEVDGNAETSSSVKHNGTSISGSTIVDTKDKAVTFIEMKDIKNDTVLNVRQTEQKFSNEISKMLKLNAKANGSNIIVQFTSVWVSKGDVKTVNVLVDNSETEDASGITIIGKTGTSTLDVKYVKELVQEDYKVKIEK